MGGITVGQPKIWQYERVNSLLDGPLRDVQGVSMSDLTGLDPNATNGAAVKFVQSMLEIGVKYDQGAAATNAITLQNYAASQSVASAQIQANSAYLQQLNKQRDALSNQMVGAMELNRSLQTQLATTPLDPNSTDYKALSARQQSAANEVTSLQADLSSINSQIASASATTMPAAPTLTPTTPGAAPESASTFSDFLSKLPSDLTKNIVSQLQSPSFPATKRLDNFMTLLYERLAREISALQDDVMRNPDNVPFLVQFDVGLYPGSKAKNHVGVVEFTMNCDGCKVYSIYPGQSSYNLANYEGASKRYSLWGALATLVGFGINADYRRQTDTLHGSLVQSVYMSGFQEGALSTDRTNQPDVPQRFGWYYGASPFETLVTPGIRSTFAIISVPSSVIKDCIDVHKCAGVEPGAVQNGKMVNVKLTINAHTNWVRRNNPFYQKAHWYESENHVGTNCLPAVCKTLKVVLPGTESLNNLSPIVRAERDRLHVTGIEYNTVNYPVSKDTSPSPPATPAPGTTQATATGTGSGTATVTISAAGTANASSSGIGGSTANATASAPPAASSSKTGSSSPADAFTGCQMLQCAALLVKLAEPIDPNLVVTVRGVPLRRVRDWRGRATSILPPAQSASDMPPPAAGAISTTLQPQRSENVSNPSLLEAEQLGPNTWMEVDSHRLLLNVSKELAGDTEFPPIQLVDPAKRALFLPLELDEGYSEVILNGFHLSARNGDQLKTYLANHFQVNLNPAGAAKVQDTPTLRPAGPYAYETFLPLFLPEPKKQRIYAFLGESGVQLLIGFLNEPADPASETPPPPHWLSSRTQVILEDRDLDLGWSLSCDPQGAELVCDVPQAEIRDAYKIVKGACDKEAGFECPSISNALDTFPSISTLQVWVEQYDPEGTETFYSPAPARLGRFPVAQEDEVAPVVNFSPWHFENADQENVTLTGCNYPSFHPDKGHYLTVLGQHIPGSSRKPPMLATDPRNNPGCWSFSTPTIVLTHPELVVEYSTSKIPESLPAARYRPYFGAPVVIPHPSSGKTLAVDQWTIDIPAGRVDCNDRLDILNGTNGLSARWRVGAFGVAVQKLTGFSTNSCTQQLQEAAEKQARDDVNQAKDAQISAKGSDKADAAARLQEAIETEKRVSSGGVKIPDWKEASKNGQIVLEILVHKTDLGNLPLKNQVQLLRGSLLSRIGKLPDLRPLFLPTKLTVVNIGTNQFALEGDNAGVIDAVTVTGSGGSINAQLAASGQQIALVTLPDAPDSSTTSKKPVAPKPMITGLSSYSGLVDSQVIIQGRNFGATAGSVKFYDGKDAPIGTNCWTDSTITVDVPPGAGEGPVSVTIGKTPFVSKPFKSTGGNSSDGKPKPASCKATASAPPPPSQPAGNKSDAAKGPKAGTYTVVPLVNIVDTQKNPKGTPEYLPLDVVGPDGKPLTFTVPESKNTSDGTAPPSTEGPTTTLTITKKTTTTSPPTPAAAAKKQ